jgi:DNA/RNA endonuclease G (NUC1)
LKLILIITVLILSLNNLFASDYKCDVLIDNTYFKTCYSFEHNSAIWSYAKITDSNNTVGITKRPSFYADKRISLEHRLYSSDFTNTDLF